MLWSVVPEDKQICVRYQLRCFLSEFIICFAIARVVKVVKHRFVSGNDVKYARIFIKTRTGQVVVDSSIDQPL